MVRSTDGVLGRLFDEYHTRDVSCMCYGADLNGRETFDVLPVLFIPLFISSLNFYLQDCIQLFRLGMRCSVIRNAVSVAFITYPNFEDKD